MCRKSPRIFDIVPVFWRIEPETGFDPTARSDCQCNIGEFATAWDQLALAPSCVTLHTARIGGGATQWVDTGWGSETAFRPIGANFNLVTTPA